MGRPQKGLFSTPLEHIVQLVDNREIRAIVLELPEQTKPCLQDKEGCRFLFVKGVYEAWQKKKKS